MGDGQQEAVEGILEGELLELPVLYGVCSSIPPRVQLLLDLWSSAADNVRIACFLAVRRVYKAGDESIKELCLKVGPASDLVELRHCLNRV